MAQFELNLDPFLKLNELTISAGFSVAGVVNIAQLSGVNGFCCTYNGAQHGLTEKMVEMLTQIAPTSRFNLRMLPKPNLVQAALDLPVQQVTFYGEGIFESYKKDLHTFVGQLKDGQRLVSFGIKPDVNELRHAYKLGGDYVELDINTYANAIHPPAQAEAREQLAILAKTAVKNRLGVAVRGQLHYQNVQPLLTIEEIENFILGEGIITRAVFVGLETAIRDMRNLLI